MRYAIFGDIHSNLEALTTFLRVIDSEPDVVPVCLGDIVGYSSSPNQCLDLIFKREIHTVMGNHERAVLRASERSTFNDAARSALDWQVSVIDADHIARIVRLPYMIQFEHFSITHANFCAPSHFGYVTKAEQATRSFKCMPGSVGFIGHTHVPMMFCTFDGTSMPATAEPIKGNRRIITIEDRMRYLINPGSLGQPRDGDPRASFVVYDPESRTITFHRFSYDCSAEMRRIKQANLPNVLGERLFVGF